VLPGVLAPGLHLWLEQRLALKVLVLHSLSTKDRAFLSA
jgi:hypothetical protein